MSSSATSTSRKVDQHHLHRSSTSSGATAVLCSPHQLPCPAPSSSLGIAHRFQYPYRFSLLHRAGVIGSTTAYYLTHHPKFGPNIAVHVLEATAVAAWSVPLRPY